MERNDQITYFFVIENYCWDIKDRKTRKKFEKILPKSGFINLSKLQQDLEKKLGDDFKLVKGNSETFLTYKGHEIACTSRGMPSGGWLEAYRATHSYICTRA